MKQEIKLILVIFYRFIVAGIRLENKEILLQLEDIKQKLIELEKQLIDNKKSVTIQSTPWTVSGLEKAIKKPIKYRVGVTVENLKTHEKQDFVSMTQAARELGVSRTSLTDASWQNYPLHGYLKCTRHGVRGGDAYEVSYSNGDSIIATSAHEAANLIGCSYSAFKYKLKPGLYKTTEYAVKKLKDVVELP